MGSLQEQLIKAGIVDKDKARKIRTDKRKGHKTNKPGKKARGNPQPGVQVISDSSKPVEFAQVEKKARDLKLNQQRQKTQQRKEIAAQIRQLVESGKLDREGAEIPYQFMDGKKVKKIYVSQEQQQLLIKNLLFIVKSGGNYELVRPEIAEKIRQRDENRILHLQADDNTQSADDDYAEYQVPDDLIW